MTLFNLQELLKIHQELFILNKIIEDGYLTADINLNFDNKGKITEDYEIKGFIKKGKLNILNKHSVKDLSFIFNIKNKEYLLRDIDGIFNEVKLLSPSIKIKEKNNYFLVNGKLLSKNDSSNTEILIKLLKKNYKNIGIESIKFSSENKFTFALSKKFKISNFNLESKIDLDSLFYKKNLLNINKFLPKFKDIVKLKDHKILISYKKNKFDIKGEGEIFLQNKVDYLNYEVNQINNNYKFKTIINFNNNVILLDF